MTSLHPKPAEPPDKKPLHSHQSIKTSLKSILSKNVKNRDEIYEIIQSLVIDLHHIITDTYLFLRLYFLYLFNNKLLPLPVIDEDFIKDVFHTIGVKGERGRPITKESRLKRIEELEIFYEKEFKEIYGHEKHSLVNISQALSYISTSIVTSIETNIKVHFPKRLAKFINVYGDLYYRKHYEEVDDKELDDLLYKTKSAILRNEFKEVPEELEHLLKTVQSFLPKNIEKCVAYDVKTRPSEYLFAFLKINWYFEKYNDHIQSIIEKLKGGEQKNEKEIKKWNNKFVKLFQPLPLRLSNVPKYIKIDTKMLIELLKEEGESSDVNEVEGNKKKYWSKYFNLKHRIFRSEKNKGYKFDYSIVTDGVGCTVCFSSSSSKNGKKKDDEDDIPYIENLKKKDYPSLKNKKIIVGDPGKRNMMYLLDEQGNKLIYTNTWRDAGSQAKECRNAMNKMIKKEGIKEKEQALSLHCSKTVDYKKFKEFIRVKHETSEKTEKFYQKEVMRKLRWRKCIGRRRTDDDFLNKIEKKFGKKEDVVVVLGDWNNKNTIKGLESTMGKGLKKLISKRFKTYQVNEFNTSKKCCNCSGDTEIVTVEGKTRDGEEIDSGIRILGCRFCARKSRKESLKENEIGRSKNGKQSILSPFKLLTRDKNSCLNMLKIVRHIIDSKDHSRPKEFKKEEKSCLLPRKKVEQ
jgi:hypothetical protein